MPVPPSSGEPLLRIAILGGGMAGLRAAYLLGKARLPCTVYEASNRFGGCMSSAKNVMAPGLVTELGGEFAARRQIDCVPHAWLTDLLKAASLHLNAYSMNSLHLEYNVSTAPLPNTLL